MNDSVAASLFSPAPVRQSFADADGNEIEFIAGAVESRGKAGVLFIELSVDCPWETRSNAFLYFRIFQQAFRLCTGC